MSRKIIAADPDADPEKEAITAPVGALTPPFADPDADPTPIPIPAPARSRPRPSLQAHPARAREKRRGATPHPLARAPGHDRP